MTLVIIIIPKKIIYVKNTIKNNVLTLIEDGKEIELRPGDASYAHSGTSHAIENRSDRPARMLAVILKV